MHDSGKHLKLFALLVCLFCSAATQAATDDDLLRLEADMLKYISTNERDSFYTVTEKLKDACKQAGNDWLFYKAWSKEAIYEATHENIPKAQEIAKALADHAMTESSLSGQYSSFHTEGVILLQKEDFDGAEKFFLKARDFRHKNFPEDSDAEDLRELMKIAMIHNNKTKAVDYGHQLLAEPNLAPHHKGRALFHLSQIAFEENNVEEYNRLYEEMKRLKKMNGIRTLNLLTEVNYHIINGDYEQALRLSEWLDADTCAERKALIYHRMGDNAKAYEYMAQYKHIFDSITNASHNNVVSNLYLRMNNDRLRLERELLRHENSRLLYNLYIVIGIAVILLLLFFVFKGRRLIKSLRHDNMMLNYGKKDAEKALKDLNELSFYESKDELPLTTTLKPNDLCNRLTIIIQKQCHKGVTMAYQTELSDDFEIKTNPDALKKLLTHLLEYSARYTQKGIIKLGCEEAGKNVKFSVTDTSPGLGDGHPRLVGMFTEHSNEIRYVGMNFNICQSITRLLHGRIWHDKEYTEGTRFCFEIPKEP
jgi:signal transduction histidine kinase